MRPTAQPLADGGLTLSLPSIYERFSQGHLGQPRWYPQVPVGPRRIFFLAGQKRLAAARKKPAIRWSVAEKTRFCWGAGGPRHQILDLRPKSARGCGLFAGLATHPAHLVIPNVVQQCRRSTDRMKCHSTRKTSRESLGNLTSKRDAETVWIAHERGGPKGLEA